MAVNLTGILFRVWAFGVVMFLLGMVLLIAGGRKYRAISVVQMVFCVFYIGCYLWIYFNPEIAVLEGEFVSERWHRRVAPHTKAYVFEKENNEMQRLYLDSHSKKTVLPFELQENNVYRVHYEARTSIIVGVETVQNLDWK